MTLSLFELESAPSSSKVRLKKRHRCLGVGCSHILTGGRPRLCFKCEEAKRDAAVAASGNACGECGDPIPRTRKFCVDCSRERAKEQKRLYDRANWNKRKNDPAYRETVRRCKRRYYKTEKWKENHRKKQKRYAASEKGKATLARFMASPKGRAKIQRANARRKQRKVENKSDV